MVVVLLLLGSLVFFSLSFPEFNRFWVDDSTCEYECSTPYATVRVQLWRQALTTPNGVSLGGCLDVPRPWSEEFIMELDQLRIYPVAELQYNQYS